MSDSDLYVTNKPPFDSNVLYFSADEAFDEPHYLSKELVKHLQQQEREIPMDVPQEPRLPVLDQGFLAQNHHHEDMSSSSYDLMISQPQPLRSGPVENTDYSHYR